MQHRRRRDAHLRHHLGVRLHEAEVIKHRVVGREVELAGNAVSFGPRLDTMKLDAVRQRDLLAASEPPAEVEMPPGAAILAIGRELQPDLLLLLDDAFDLAILDRLELGGRDLALSSLGARALDRGRAQDGADMIGTEGGLGSRTHSNAPGVRVPPLRSAERSGRKDATVAS